VEVTNQSRFVAAIALLKEAELEAQEPVAVVQRLAMM
jgi:hypothetical protein